MALNYVFVFFFLLSFVAAFLQWFLGGNSLVFNDIIQATFDMSKTGFEISLYLTGAMTLWLGLMNIGEKAGMINYLSRLVSPFLTKLFPEVPKDHPAMGSMIMNFSANMLGLDNAATPLGLKAMKELQTLNKSDDTASNAQIMFLVLNTSGLTIIPVSILLYRAQQGAENPSDVFIPILIATFFSTLAGMIAVSIYQKINLLNKTVLLYLGSLSLMVALIIKYFSGLDNESASHISTVAANVILFTIITSFVVFGFVKKLNVFEEFIEGAKDGFSISIKIIPYLVGMLVAIGVFRASGCMDFAIKGLAYVFQINTEVLQALPTALMKPLSGSGARAMMVETMGAYGADSFSGRLSCIFQGSTETTFYVLAVYFGSVAIKNTRHALTCGLIADAVGILTAIGVAYLFFG